jgi:hypothetical protein
MGISDTIRKDKVINIINSERQSCYCGHKGFCCTCQLNDILGRLIKKIEEDK